MTTNYTPLPQYEKSKSGKDTGNKQNSRDEHFASPYDILLSARLDLESKGKLLETWFAERLRFLYMHYHERCWERDTVIEDINLCIDFLKRQYGLKDFKNTHQYKTH